MGVYTLLRKRALIGDAIAHAVLPGICIAFMLSGVRNTWVLFAGAVVTGSLAVYLVDLVTRRSRLKPDAAIALVLSVFFGAGILLLTIIQSSGNAAQSGLDKFLFGKAAAMLPEDLWLFGVVLLLVVVVLFFGYKEFKLLAFDKGYAQSQGIPVKALEMALSSLTVLTVATGIQAVGVVLMSSLLIAPAAASRYWTNRLSGMLLLSAIMASIGAYIGAFISYTKPGMPTGPWIVVVLSCITLASMILAPNQGVLARYLQRRKHRNKILQENILKAFFHLGEKRDNQALAYEMEVLRQQRDMPVAHLKSGLRSLVRQGALLDSNDGYQLTRSGLEAATRVVRLHRLWELYLSRHLNIAPDHVHEDAEGIEHLITPELERELELLLDSPGTDPHDSQIPYTQKDRNR
jgi:manganese/zinc/iron transport system permease protein